MGTAHAASVPAMAPFDADGPPAPALREYAVRYSLAIDGVVHRAGSFRSSGRRLAGHLFRPIKGDPAGSAVVIHGYFDHTAVMAPLVRFLVGRGMRVAAFDLPGHGLSEGRRAAINDFARYGDALADWLAVVGPALTGPVVLIGHSTGGAAILDYLRRYPDPRIAGVILAAPLVRPAHWGFVRRAAGLFYPLIETVPRIFRKSSSDPEFQSFIRSDPLQPRKIPLVWLRALADWVPRLDECSWPSTTVWVIQGTADGVVDWRYNLDYLSRKLPGLVIRRIPGARHHLFNERAGLRREALGAVAEGLEAMATGHK